MKNFKLGQILRSAAKKSTLLVVALVSFQVVASKMPTQSKKIIAKKYVKSQVAPEQVSSALVENDSYKKTVEVEPLVDVRTNQLEDGTVVETKTTIEPDVENGTVKTTVEEWTMYDYVKAGAIGAGVLGAVGLGIAYQNQIADKFNSGYDRLAGLASQVSHGAEHSDGSSIQDNKQSDSEVLTDDAQAKLEALQVSGGHSGKSLAKIISWETIAEQQKSLDKLENIEGITTKLRLSDATSKAKILLPLMYVVDGVQGGVSNMFYANRVMNQAPGLTNLTRLEKLKIMQTVAKEGARSGVVTSVKSPKTYGFVAGTFLYDNINPATAQTSIDTTDQNIDTEQLYQ